MHVLLRMEIFSSTFKRLRYSPYVSPRDNPNRVEMTLFLCFKRFMGFLFLCLG
jgi:hypothetical protein